MTKNRNTFVRALHDIGAAAWFGGSLMGAVALNGASRELKNPSERATVASAGWARWTPVAAAAIGAHGIGGLGLLLANRGRVAHQDGVLTNTRVKTVVTLAALASTVWSGVLGQRMAEALPIEATAGAVPSEATPEDVTRDMQQMRVLQWVTPALMGLVIVLGAQQGEQQRPGEVASGVRSKAFGRARAAVASVRCSDEVASWRLVSGCSLELL